MTYEAKYPPGTLVTGFGIINKQTYFLEAVQNTLNSKISEPAKLAWIEVIAREALAELAPQIAALKASV